VTPAVLIVGLIAWGILLYLIFAPMDSGEASDRLREEEHQERAAKDRLYPHGEIAGVRESGLDDEALERWFSLPDARPRA
jgi:hypothetical protein